MSKPTLLNSEHSGFGCVGFCYFQEVVCVLKGSEMSFS